MGILNFNQFITEKLGVSLPSLQFVDFLEKRCLKAFISFSKSKNTTMHEIDKIGFNSIKKYLNKEIYSEFPIVGFEIVYDFKKYTNTYFSREFRETSKKSTMYVGGWSMGFGNKNWKNYSKLVDPMRKGTKKGIILQIGIEVSFNKDKMDISDKKILEELEDNINSTIYHELNHGLENYKKINIDTKNKFLSTGVSVASLSNYHRYPKPIWEIWNSDFTWLIYLNEDYELRSNVQEAFYFLKKYPDRDIKDLKIYKNADKMENFNADTFYNSLLKEISKYPKYKGDEINIAEKLKEMWIYVYKKEIKNGNGSKMIPLNMLENMNCKDFIDWWSKKINKSGNYLKKKLYKLKNGIHNEEI